MKIPFYFSIPLALVTMGLVWWQGTKGKDFTTPPDQATLASVKQEVREELKATDSIAPEEAPQAIKVKPKTLLMPQAEAEAQAAAEPALKPEDFGDLTVSPGLDCYLKIAERGAALMIDLATQLEIKGETQRALLAWERVLDATEADAAQLDTARKAVERLRSQVPLWNVDPIASHTVTLHATCDRDRAKTLEPLLDQMMAEMHQASAGLIIFKLSLQSGPKPAADAPPQPVTLSFSGPVKEAAATKTLSVPLTSDEPAAQTSRLLGQIYKLIRDDLGRQQALRPLMDSSEVEPSILLESAITRRAWQVWGQSLDPKNP